MNFAQSAFVLIGTILFSLPASAQIQSGENGRGLDANQRVGSDGTNPYQDPLSGYNPNYPFGDHLGGGYFGNRWPDLRIPGRFEEERFFRRDLQFDYQASRGWDHRNQPQQDQNRFGPNHPSRQNNNGSYQGPVDRRLPGMVPDTRINTRIEPQRVGQRIDGRQQPRSLAPDRQIIRNIDRPNTRIHDEFIDLLKLDPISKIARDIRRLQPNKLRELMEAYQERRENRDEPFSEDVQEVYDSLLDELDELLDASHEG